MKYALIDAMFGLLQKRYGKNNTNVPFDFKKQHNKDPINSFCQQDIPEDTRMSNACFFAAKKVRETHIT